MASETGAVMAHHVSTTDTANVDAGEELRHSLVDQLCAQGTVRTSRVEAALRAVPRHVFVPGVCVQEAYTDSTITTKSDGPGAMISAASQPTIVAMMLEQLEVEPGQHILELGAGTGYFAALLAHLVGDRGRVTTMDVDEDIVAGARHGLTAAGYPNVRVILGDGALGYAQGAPFDRIVATVGVWDLPPAWREQVAVGGRLVVPMRLRGSVSRSVVFDADTDDGRWRSVGSRMCSFTPLRKAGIADDSRRIVDLNAEGTVRLEIRQDQSLDEPRLTGVLDSPPSRVWTGVGFGASESAEWLWLWLACCLDNALSRLSVDPPAMDAGLITPQFGWGTMATTDHGALAYLTMRLASPPEPAPGDHTVTDDRWFEVGIIAHGPRRDDLATRVLDHIRTWNRDHRSHTAQIEVQPLPADQAQTDAQFVFTTPRNQLLITWT